MQYYKRPEIQQAILDHAEHKEVAVSYGGEGYGKRPDTLQYHQDILAHVKNGATSFHASEELWINPMQIQPGLPRAELDALRKGWDLILDIDCPELNYSKLASHFVVQALKYHNVKSISVKFSGNHGFHIGVPFAAFPANLPTGETKNWFPEGPRRIATYFGHFIKNYLRDEFMKMDLAQISAKLGKPIEEFTDRVGASARQIDPLKIITIDTVFIAPRHLYRMPYSLNEKSGLVSVPIDPERILSFDKLEALPSKVVPNLKFLDDKNATEGEAKEFFRQALDFASEDIRKKIDKEDYAQSQRKERTIKTEFEMPQVALAETLFPPCIKLASQGMRDGKKRALFAITNFLVSVGWEYDKILEWLKAWNLKNPEPLRDNIIEGHVRYHKQTKKVMLPPNCREFWSELGICAPDGLCNRIKNPVNYATRKAWILNQQAEEQRLEDEKKARKAQKLNNTTERDIKE